MPNPPYSGSVLIIRENQDGFLCEIFHWDDVPDGTSIPPRGSITNMLVPRPGDDNGPTFHRVRSAANKAALISAFTQYLTKFPDTQ